MKWNAVVDNVAVYCTPSCVPIKQWDGGRGGGGWGSARSGCFFFLSSPRLLSLCWIVLFDLECSERRALCNISSTHMAVCVTAKHMGVCGEVAVVAAVAPGAVESRGGGVDEASGRKWKSSQSTDVRGGKRLLTSVSARCPY